MKLSARNKLKGKILDVKKGATTAHVRLEIA
ncbi:MAG: transporter, partial [Xanthobacteraceae bacterium]